MKAMLDLLMILFIELQFIAYIHAFSIDYKIDLDAGKWFLESNYPANAQIFAKSLISFVEFQIINP